MTARVCFSLHCDYGDCKESVATTDHYSDEARRTAARRHDWYYDPIAEEDLCPRHRRRRRKL